MAETMKAAVVHEYGKALVIEELPVPEVRPGGILVKVEACGVCHTDLHASEGDWPVKPPLNRTGEPAGMACWLHRVLVADTFGKIRLWRIRRWTGRDGQ